MQLSEAADVIVPALYGAADGAAAVVAELRAAGAAVVGPPAEAMALAADRQAACCKHQNYQHLCLHRAALRRCDPPPSSRRRLSIWHQRSDIYMHMRASIPPTHGLTAKAGYLVNRMV